VQLQYSTRLSSDVANGPMFLLLYANTGRVYWHKCTIQKVVRTLSLVIFDNSTLHVGLSTQHL